jgi:2'-5' RNA ligase
VLWVGVEEEEPLLSLQSHLETEMEKAGFPREQRKFHPHLTLGRVKNPSALGEILSLLEKSKDQIFGEMKAEKITFFQSVLKPSGAEYSVISEYKLK